MIGCDANAQSINLTSHEEGRRDGPDLNKALGKADDLLYILETRPKHNR